MRAPTPDREEVLCRSKQDDRLPIDHDPDRLALDEGIELAHVAPAIHDPAAYRRARRRPNRLPVRLVLIFQVAVIIKTESHLHGEVILENAFPAEYASLMGTLNGLSIPLRTVDEFTASGRPLSPKRHMRSIGGKRLPFILPVDQAALNGELNGSFRDAGWTNQPVASGTLAGADAPLGLKGDFHRNGVFVEVEFGNIASMHRDFFKFQIANRSGTGQVAVLIAATERLARFFDSGVTTFEAARRHLPYLAIGIQMPVCFVGFEPDSFDAIGDRYEELRRLCEENGLACHPFATALGADVMDPQTGSPRGEAESESAGGERVPNLFD